MKLFTRITRILVLVCCVQVYAQTEQQKLDIIREYDIEKIESLIKQFEKMEDEQKREAIALAKINNWEIKMDLPNGRIAELMGVTKDGKPIYYVSDNVGAAKSTRTNYLHSGGGLGLDLNGENMVVYIWDEGVPLTTHTEYDGPGGNNRTGVFDGTTNISDHTTHVTGTILAHGRKNSAKGMAPHARSRNYDRDKDLTEATSATLEGMLISNHSYSWDIELLSPWVIGAYIQESRNWDELMFAAPYYLMITSAGNDGLNDTINDAPLNGESEYDKLSGTSTAKNNLVVANAKAVKITSEGDLFGIRINEESSEGPTDDLRIKPDITGDGTRLQSSCTSGIGYCEMTGTSMACANVSGSLLLLQEHYQNLNEEQFMRAATLKGLALHTADDAGVTGPDSHFGWGLLNTKKASEVISNNNVTSTIREFDLSDGQTSFFPIRANCGEQLRISISWTDPPGIPNNGIINDQTPVLVNDLDMIVLDDNGSFPIQHEPWRLTGVTTNGKGNNGVDPFERIDIDNAEGLYTLRIDHKGVLSGGHQNFTLIISGGILDNGGEGCNDCSDGAVAQAEFVNPNAIINLPFAGGSPVDVYEMCLSSSIVVDGSASTCEDRYFIEIVEFDLFNGIEVGAPLYSDWICSGCTVPSNINIPDYVSPGDLNPEKVYKFKLVVSAPINEFETFFKVANCLVDPNDTDIGDTGASDRSREEGLNISKDEEVLMTIASKINIYPNPTQDRLYIDISSLEGNYQVSIFDVLGNQIFRKDIVSGIHNNVNLSQVASGMYLIVISDNSGQKIKVSRIIKE